MILMKIKTDVYLQHILLPFIINYISILLINHGIISFIYYKRTTQKYKTGRYRY